MAYYYNRIGIPKSRLATFDVYSVGKRKYHVAALLEFDVTETREILNAIRELLV